MSTDEGVHKIQSTGSALHKLSARLTFPINSREELSAQLAGLHTALAGVPVTLDDVKSSVSAQWFPIVSEDNFTAKALELFRTAEFRRALLAKIPQSGARFVPSPAPVWPPPAGGNPTHGIAPRQGTSNA